MHHLLLLEKVKADRIRQQLEEVLSDSARTP
jgi:hypothetical protein